MTKNLENLHLLQSDERYLQLYYNHANPNQGVFMPSKQEDHSKSTQFLLGKASAWALVIMLQSVISMAWLLLIQWPRGLYLHTKLVALACLAVVAR